MRPESWKALEQEVAELLRLVGLEAQQNITLQGRQTDVYCRNTDGLMSARILIECKFSSKSDYALPVSFISEFCARLTLARSTGQADFGWLITNAKIPANGWTVLRESSLGDACQLLTVDELFNKFVNAENYLNQLNLSLPRSATGFVDPRLQILDSSPGLRPSKDLRFRTFVRDWLNSNTTIFVLLGDFGQGKSTCCHELIREARRDTAIVGGRLPIYVRLRDVANQGYNIQAILRVCLQEYFGFNYHSFELLRLLAARGKLLFIFDGLDEISFSLRWNDLFSALREILTLAVGDNRILITSRPALFPNEMALSSAVLRILPPKESKRFVSAKIRYFSEPEIHDAITNFGLESPNDLFHKISRIQGLKDLMRRPITLRMILESYVHGELDVEAVSPIDVYRSYTAEWLHRDAWRSNIASISAESDRDFKREFVVQLAWELFITSQFLVNASFVERSLTTYFKANADLEHLMPAFTKEIMVCSFLDWQPNGSLTFSHMSFFDYFVALRIAEQVEVSGLEILREHLIDESVAFFLFLMLPWRTFKNNPEFEESIRASRIFCFNLLLLQGHSDEPVLETVKLPTRSNLDLKYESSVMLTIDESVLSTISIGCDSVLVLELNNTDVDKLNLLVRDNLSLVCNGSNIRELTLHSSADCDIQLATTRLGGGALEAQKCDIVTTGSVSCGGIRLNTQSNGKLRVDGEDIANHLRGAALSRLGISTMAPERIRKRRKQSD